MRTDKNRFAVIVAAAGSSRRMGGTDKQFALIGGKPVLWWTLQLFVGRSDVCQLLVTVSEANRERIEALLTEMRLRLPWALVMGGAERQDSVRAALCHLSAEATHVAVHDGARPLTSKETIDEVFAAAVRFGAAIAAVPVKDTIKEVNAGHFVSKTLDRSLLWQVQTPQAAEKKALVEAYAKAHAQSFQATDDSSLLERIGSQVRVAPGDYRNIKITTPEDLRVADIWLTGGGNMRAPRVGLGYDVHKLIAGRPLIVGGVTVPHEKGLEGHSDADVLLHAISDALLGAAALGDIGKHFPDKDPAFRGASSLRLLGIVRKLVEDAGFVVCNVDAVIVAEKPKFASYVEAMRYSIAEVLQVDVSCVGVKATTTEGLGFAGRKEGIAAYATVSLSSVQAV